MKNINIRKILVRNSTTTIETSQNADLKRHLSSRIWRIPWAILAIVACFWDSLSDNLGNFKETRSYEHLEFPNLVNSSEKFHTSNRSKYSNLTKN